MVILDFLAGVRAGVLVEERIERLVCQQLA
jgi:hypothetical protein